MMQRGVKRYFGRTPSLPTLLLNRLQSVLNAAARSIAGLRRSDHVTDALVSFRWLRAPERIKFILAVIVCTELSTAQHLGICLISCATSLICRRKVDFGRLLPAFSTSALHDLSLSMTAHSVLLNHGSEALYPRAFSLPRHLQQFGGNK